MKKLFFLLLFGSLQSIYAQTSSTQLKNTTHILFNTEGVKNLLVLVSDSMGRTIYMDHPYNYKGYYDKMVPLPNRGRYYLTIDKDGIKTRQQINID